MIVTVRRFRCTAIGFHERVLELLLISQVSDGKRRIPVVEQDVLLVLRLAFLHHPRRLERGLRDTLLTGLEHRRGLKNPRLGIGTLRKVTRQRVICLLHLRLRVQVRLIGEQKRLLAAILRRGTTGTVTDLPALRKRDTRKTGVKADTTQTRQRALRAIRVTHVVNIARLVLSRRDAQDIRPLNHTPDRLTLPIMVGTSKKHIRLITTRPMVEPARGERLKQGDDTGKTTLVAPLRT